jgi:hypothetical protein
MIAGITIFRTHMMPAQIVTPNKLLVKAENKTNENSHLNPSSMKDIVGMTISPKIMIETPIKTSLNARSIPNHEKMIQY